jgi:hypothetical protein
LRRSVSSMKSGQGYSRAATVVAKLVRPDEELLAEDPSIWVALGRQPLVMDPFMIMRLEHTRPQQVDPLISWIANRRFHLVVLVVALEDRSSDFWWTDFHFGPRVAHALRESYRFDRNVGPYFLYRPVTDSERQSPGTAAVATQPDGKQ